MYVHKLMLKDYKAGCTGGIPTKSVNKLVLKLHLQSINDKQCIDEVHHGGFPLLDTFIGVLLKTRKLGVLFVD
jgi:hypothetical protein